ncbi:T6SS immunity protein Tdi1 domain-containing protein [Frondihabitans australicus]|uniref:Uncharacterized protein DUF1851 n=1 Tax=Frondihabitans australicus TaxID=386892 RepID=A0A495IML0_9MICO|nr:T6SS immunity protein Tdi1 domain-containing protein [Frondihabitans australicus]RKR76406.1 uncharacterized protein DUF1851 [Frondihabitans australicus]
MLTPDETVYGDLTTWAPAPFGSLFADANYCGRSFDRGLLRFHNAESGAEAQELVTAAFTRDVAPGTAFFAIDWLGRQFGARPARPGEGDGQPVVVIANVGSGEYEGEVAPLDEFIGFLGSDAAATTLGAEAYAAWREANGAPQLDFDECLGYRIPLFLGGTDSPDNVELNDVSVYWTLVGQVFDRSRDLPEGTRITSVGVDPEA